MEKLIIKTGEYHGEWIFTNDGLMSEKKTYLNIKTTTLVIPYNIIDEIREFQQGFFSGTCIIKIRSVGFVEAKINLINHAKLIDLVNNSRKNPETEDSYSQPYTLNVTYDRMALIGLPLVAILFLIFVNLDNNINDNQNNASPQETEPVELVNFTYEQACKAVISIEFGADLKRIKSKPENSIFKVWYNRKVDGKRFTYKCIADKSGYAIWGNYPDGRWRDGSNGFEGTDTIFSFSENKEAGKLLIKSSTGDNYDFSKKQF